MFIDNLKVKSLFWNGAHVCSFLNIQYEYAPFCTLFCQSVYRCCISLSVFSQCTYNYLSFSLSLNNENGLHESCLYLSKLCLWQWLGPLVVYQVDYQNIWHPVQWGHRMRTLFQQDKGIVPALWVMQFKWEYMHSSRKGQFNNQWTFDNFWACRQYCFYWSLRCCPACLRRPLKIALFLVAFEWNLLQCSVSVL